MGQQIRSFIASLDTIHVSLAFIVVVFYLVRSQFKSTDVKILGSKLD